MADVGTTQTDMQPCRKHGIFKKIDVASIAKKSKKSTANPFRGITGTVLDKKQAVCSKRRRFAVNGPSGNIPKDAACEIFNLYIIIEK